MKIQGMHFLNSSFSEYTFKIYYYHVYGVHACVCVSVHVHEYICQGKHI